MSKPQPAARPGAPDPSAGSGGSPGPAARPAAARGGRVVFTLAFAGIVASMMQSVITPLIARLPEILDTSSSNAAWIVTVTLLSGAVAMPVSGRLGDMLGKRRMILVCTVPLIAGSALCALAGSFPVMLVGRGLQGLGLGIVGLAVSLIRDLVPRERVSSSLALVSASLGIGGGLGLPLAAAVAQYADWRIMFWACTALSALIAVLVLFLVPEGRAARTGARFDLPGALGLAVGVVGFLLAVSKGSVWGWTSTATLGCWAVAVVALGLWGWWELRVPAPLVDLRTTARPRVLVTNLASVFAGFGMYVTMLVTPQVMMLPASTGFGLGQSMLATGLWMLPGGVIQVLLSPVGGRLIDAKGPKFTLTLGCGVIASGYVVALALLGSAPGLMVAHTVIKAGVGIAYGAMPSLIMGGVPRDGIAAANGFNSLMRALGGSVGAAVIGVVLAQTTVLVAGHELLSEAGVRAGLSVGIGVGAAAAIIAACIPVHPARTPGETPEEDRTPAPRTAPDPAPAPEH